MSHLKPTNDFVFKKIFGETKNEDILKDLLSAILTDIKIHKVTVNKDVSLERKLITDKLGILDVVATLNNGIIVNIEMQINNYENTIERSLFYGAGIFHENLHSGQRYLDAPRTISIWIANYDIFSEGPFHERAMLKRDYENIILTDKMEFHYIQLSKFKKKCKRISSKLEQWLQFIINDNLEEIKMSDNKYIKKAEEELEYLTGDEEARRLAYLREKAIRDEQSALITATRKGIAEGKLEGKLENQKEIAKKMLTKNVDINLIIEFTGLSKEQIEKL